MLRSGTHVHAVAESSAFTTKNWKMQQYRMKCCRPEECICHEEIEGSGTSLAIKVKDGGTPLEHSVVVGGTVVHSVSAHSHGGEEGNAQGDFFIICK